MGSTMTMAPSRSSRSLFPSWAVALFIASATTSSSRYPSTVCHAFHFTYNYKPTATRRSVSISNVRRCAEAGVEQASVEDITTSSAADRRANKCGYLFEGRWEQRKDLAELQIGDKLLGRKLDGCDLLEAKTGPKIYFECGVGRKDAKGRWQMVNGMLRLGRRGARKSVTMKRVKRMTDKVVELYVSRIDASAGRLEVTTSQEKADDVAASTAKRVPASSLKVGDELVGTVGKVVDYGVFVDVGANRMGLLHIQRVADLFDRYIKKKEGLVEAGLERGAKIRVAVVSNEKKRLFLDFTPDVKEEAEAERNEQQRKNVEAAAEKAKAKEAAARQKKEEEMKAQQDTAEEDDIYADDISPDEAAAWAAYEAGDDDADDWAAFAAGDDSAYDEDDDIEDALGIGTYS